MVEVNRRNGRKDESKYSYPELERKLDDIIDSYNWNKYEGRIDLKTEVNMKISIDNNCEDI
jgi:hypothetical protein